METEQPKRLTPREIEICALLAQGFSNAEIAAQLAVSERTVETHRAHLIKKTGLHTRSEFFRFAMRERLVKFE